MGDDPAAPHLGGAERIRQDRAEAAAHAQLVTDHQAAGVTITGAMPDGAVLLSHLMHDGGVLDPDAHAQCPGRGAYSQSWNPTDAVWYCASPAEHGHAPRYPHPAPPGTWLTFLASLGYELSPIEQVVADSTPYTGDSPDDRSTLTADPGADGTAPDADAARDDAQPDAA